MPRIDQRGSGPVKDITLRRPGATAIMIRVFPGDPRFSDDVNRVVRALDTSGDAETIRTRLETELRKWYPRTTIHERDEFGALNDDDALWYVLRDGRVRHLDLRVERLIAALANARDVTEDADAALDHAREVVATRSGVAHRDDPGAEDADG